VGAAFKSFQIEQDGSLLYTNKKHLEGTGNIDLDQNAATPVVNQSLIASREPPQSGVFCCWRLTH
jgi:hypothetical protein